MLNQCAAFALVLIILSLDSTISNAQTPGEGIVVKNAILKPTQTVSVAAGVAGVIESVLVTEGDVSSIDQAIVRIRSDEAKLNHERAKLALLTATAKADRDVDIRLAEKSAQVAEQELGRTLKANSLAADTYPANEVDRYRLMFERAKIEVERYKLDQQLAILAKKQAEIELKQTQQAIDRHTITSMTQAMVVSVEKHAGEWTEPSTKILELMSIDRLRVEGFVDANDGLELKKGQQTRVMITAAKSTQSVPGKVMFVSQFCFELGQATRSSIVAFASELADLESKTSLRIQSLVSHCPFDDCVATAFTQPFEGDRCIGADRQNPF